MQEGPLFETAWNGSVGKIALRRANPQHVKDVLGIAWIVLVPAIGQCLPCQGERHRRYQPNREPSLDPAPRDGTVVVAGRLESAQITGLP